MTKFIVIAKLCFIVFACTSSTNSTETKEQISLLDSLNVLVGVGGYFGGSPHPPTPEEERLKAIYNSLHGLPFVELEKLFLDTNSLKRVYGFVIACDVSLENISEEHCKIFDDTTPILLYTRRGLVDKGITVGLMASHAYKFKKEPLSKSGEGRDVESAVRSFIQSYATYPSAYVSLKFDNYSKSQIGDKNFYEVCHTYRLKSNVGNIDEVVQFFILDTDFKVNLIENARSNVIYAPKPLYGNWLEKYGRPLTAEDSITLEMIKF